MLEDSKSLRTLLIAYTVGTHMLMIVEWQRDSARVHMIRGMPALGEIITFFRKNKHQVTVHWSN
jgi:hypothetical protein